MKLGKGSFLFHSDLLTDHEPWRSGVSAERRHYSGGKSAALCRDAATRLRFMGRVALREALIPVMVLGWLGLGIPAQSSAGAAPAEPAAASPPVSYTFDLNYQETDEVLVSGSVGIRLQSAPFQKEPALPGQNVFRGSLQWRTLPKQATPFIWDKGRGRLYLDLNRNRDLTDDPKGIFASASRDDRQTFTNIHLVLPIGAGDRPVRLQLEFRERRADPVNAYVGVCSFLPGGGRLA